jgi:hypothetical protein
MRASGEGHTQASVWGAAGGAARVRVCANTGKLWVGGALADQRVRVSPGVRSRTSCAAPASGWGWGGGCMCCAMTRHLVLPNHCAGNHRAATSHPLPPPRPTHHTPLPITPSPAPTVLLACEDHPKVCTVDASRSVPTPIATRDVQNSYTAPFTRRQLAPTCPHRGSHRRPGPRCPITTDGVWRGHLTNRARLRSRLGGGLRAQARRRRRGGAHTHHAVKRAEIQTAWGKCRARVPHARAGGKA